jgi:hypothetical protein
MASVPPSRDDIINSVYHCLCQTLDGLDTKEWNWTAEQHAECDGVSKMAYINNELVVLNSNMLLPKQTAYRGTDVATTQCPPANLGDLANLPLGLINMVISFCDPTTLAAFKTLNRQARHILNSHLEYRLIDSLAPTVFKSLRKVEIEPTIDLKALFNVLCSTSCKDCGKFGEYLYLLSAERICEECLMDNKRHQPIPKVVAVSKYALTSTELQSVPSMQTLPGKYGRFEPSPPFTTVGYRTYLSYTSHSASLVDDLSAAEACAKGKTRRAESHG